MGEVYAAYHPELDRRIALKMVFGPRDWGLDRQRRLLREAQIIARLNHPNIVTVHDARTVGERVYVAMEFVDGQTIAAWLHETERSWQEIVDAFVSAGRGLAAAHAANVVHRDFKPQNVMIGRDGRVRVMDFGLARPLRDEPELEGVPDVTPAPNDLTSTTVGAVVGTPAYMAPEQLRGHPADTRTDQFSFCVAFHEAIYGARPGRRHDLRRPPRGAGAAVAEAGDPARPGSRSAQAVRFDGRAAPRRRAGQNPRCGGGCPCWRRRALVLVAAVAAGRATRARQFACTPPPDRLQAVWPTQETPGTRRAAIHRLFSSSGVADAENIWNRLAGVLDDRGRRWASMYQDACEATHIRGEQSAEVLDLRMSCLDGQSRRDAGVHGRAARRRPSAAVGRALATANALTPIQRCADVKGLRLQLPLPSDPAQRTAGRTAAATSQRR